MFYSVVAWCLILHVTSACLSYKSAYQRQHHAESSRRWFSIWFTTADWWCCPKREENEKCVWVYVFFFSQTNREEGQNSSADKHAIISLRVIQALTHSNAHTHTHTICLPLWIKYTPTHVVAVLADEVKGRPHLPKCLRWTDCGGVMNGWSRLGGGAEETISAMLISPLLLRPPSIPHPPVLSLGFSLAFSQSIIVSLFPSHQLDQLTVRLLLCPSLSLYLNEFAPYRH